MPITAPTLTIEMFATVTTRRPAKITGTAIGRSTAISRCNGLYPTAIADCRTSAGTERSPSITLRISRETV